MSIFKNFLYNVFYQILIMVLPLITAPYIARVLGAECIGIYSYTYSIAYYFVLFGQLGLSVYGNRTIASVRNNKEKLSYTFCTLFLIQFVLSILSCLCFGIYILYFAKKYVLFFSLQFIYVVSNLFDISWFYFGIEEFKLTVLRNALVKIFSVIFILLFVKSVNDLGLYIIIMAGSVLLGHLSLWLKIKDYIDFKLYKLNDCLPHLKPIFILFLPTIATSLYRVMDKIMLGLRADISQLGYYENSEKFISISLGVINALGMVMIPKMSNLLANKDFKTINEYMYKSIEGIFILAAPIAFGLAGISDKLSVVFYGVEFSACGEIITILSISILFSTWANLIRTQYLVPNRKDKEYIISMFTGAFANIVLNLILIPKIGAIGAAIGTVSAELFVALFHSIFVNNKLPLIKYLKLVIPYVFFGFIMYLVINIASGFIQNSITGLFTVIGIGGGVYLILLTLYTFINRGQYYYIFKNFIEKFWSNYKCQ